MRSLPLATLLILACSSPAAAQIVGRPDYGPVGTPDPFLGNGELPGPGVGRELRQVNRRIDAALRSGAITRREARQMRRQAAGIAYLAGVYRFGGLSRSERHELQSRIQVLRDSVNRQGRTADSGGRGR